MDPLARQPREFGGSCLVHKYLLDRIWLLEDWELKSLKHGAASARRAGNPRRSAFSYNPRPDSDEE